MFDSIDESVAMRREGLRVRWKIVNAPKPLKKSTPEFLVAAYTLIDSIVGEAIHQSPQFTRPITEDVHIIHLGI
jgi:hypothetical protein